LGPDCRTAEVASLTPAVHEERVLSGGDRPVAMDGATRDTERMLKGLVELERRERQGEITRPVLELIAAWFAVGQRNGCQP
jgi:F0F1-type ATP synthase gamma subunit